MRFAHFGFVKAFMIWGTLVPFAYGQNKAEPIFNKTMIVEGFRLFHVFSSVQGFRPSFYKRYAFGV